jgi:hypothetical protein
VIRRRGRFSFRKRCSWRAHASPIIWNLFHPALSKEQADWLEKAIAEHRRVKSILAEMRRRSRQIMRAHFPDTQRRRPLSRRVWRLI